jgi:glycosyltransferase involved in cell wall biosynthesis
LINNGFKADRIVSISGSVDTQLFQPDVALQPDAAKAERDIICVARLEFPKGIDVLLHAWHRMMCESADWRQHLKPRLLIVGTGTLKEQIHQIARDLQLDDSVTFLGLHRDVTRLLQQSWGFVLPSRWEGMPNALLEAMACGLPCVATRVSGSEDIITDNVNGLLVESEQPAAMAQALRRIIEDRELARKLGQEARQTILREYQLRRVTEETLQFYYYILKKKTEEPSLVLGELIK